MQKYTPPDAEPVKNMLLMACTSMILGVAVGLLYCMVSQYYYVVFVSPILLAFAAKYFYVRVFHGFHVQHGARTVTIAILTGLVIAITFHLSLHSLFRKQVMDVCDERGIDRQECSQRVDRWLTQETGFTGPLGLLILKARKGQTHELLFVHATGPVHQSSVQLKGLFLWVYWLAEAMFMVLGVVAAAVSVKSLRFSRDSKSWYSEFETEIASIPIEHKSLVVSYLSAGDVRGLARLLVDSDKTRHPKIEVYKQSATGPAACTLVTFKETFDTGERIRRSLLGEYELQPNEIELMSQESSVTLQGN